MKKKSRRARHKYPGLKKDFNLPIRRELYDQDYIEKLSEEEKDWLSRFNEEFNNACFKHKGGRIHPVECVEKIVKKTGKKRQVDVYKKSCEDMNNSRNRDAFSILRINDMLQFDGLTTTRVCVNDFDEYENTLNFMIDLQNKLKKSIEDT